jgi:hypothetical protein
VSAPEPDADEPLPEYYETAAGMTEPTAEKHEHAPSSSLEHLLVHGLGATIVGEHQKETQGEDEQ